MISLVEDDAFAKPGKRQHSGAGSKGGKAASDPPPEPKEPVDPKKKLISTFTKDAYNAVGFLNCSNDLFVVECTELSSSRLYVMQLFITSSINATTDDGSRKNAKN